MSAVLLGSVRTIDNLDDRKQIVIQLDHLTAEKRIAFLKWAVNQAPINKNSNGLNPIKVVNDSVARRLGQVPRPFPWGSSEQVYFDLMTAIQQHAVPIDIVLGELERRAAAASKRIWKQ